MSRQALTLLLCILAVGAAQGISYNLEVFYGSGPVDSELYEYVGTPRTFTGRLLSDSGCPPDSAKATQLQFCTPVPSTAVDIYLDGVGQVTAAAAAAQLPAGASAAVAHRATTASGRSNLPATRRLPSSSSSGAQLKPLDLAVTVTTDNNGEFSFTVRSSVAGNSLINVASPNALGNNANIIWQNPEYIVTPLVNPVFDTVGYTRKVGFRLTLVPLNQSPSRDQPGKAAPLPAPTSKAPANVPLPAGSPKTPANAPQATLRLLEDIPVADKTVVFSRKDLQAVLSPRVNKLSPNRPAAGGAAAVSGQGADLKAGSPSKPAGVDAGAREEPQFQPFGTGTTDANGVVEIDVSSPVVAGVTQVRAVFTDDNSMEWGGSASINWVDPVVATATVTDNNYTITTGEDTVLAVTIIGADGTPQVDVPVTFNVRGDAFVARMRSAAVPLSKDTGVLDVIDRVQNTISSGETSTRLQSNVASVNTVDISYRIFGRDFSIPTFELIWADPVPPVTYSLTIDGELKVNQFVGEPVTFTGTLLSDDGCRVPVGSSKKAAPFCTPVAFSTVAIQGFGVGQFAHASVRASHPSAAVRRRPASTAAVNSSNTLGADRSLQGPKAPSNIKPGALPLDSLDVTTDSQGRFAFVATSSDEGSTEFYATYSVTGDTSAQGHITWQQPVFYVVPDQETVLATLGFNRTLSFTLWRGPLDGNPVARGRQAAPPSSSLLRAPANITRFIGIPPGSDPVPDVTLTFSRVDFPYGDGRKAPAIKPAAVPAGQQLLLTPGSPATNTKAGVRQEPVQFDTGVTDKNGAVSIDVPSPHVLGVTQIIALYKNPVVPLGLGDAISFTQIGWVAPVVPSVSVTNNLATNIPIGTSTVVTVTIVDDQNTPQGGVSVFFSVTGPAVLVGQQPTRKAPRALDTAEFQRTDVNGQASIALTSDIAGDNTISIYYVVNDQTFTLPDFTLSWGALADFTTITLAPKRQALHVGRSAELTATVADDAGVGVAGVTVHITVSPSRASEEVGVTQNEGALEASAAAETAAVRVYEAVSAAQGEATTSLTASKPGRYMVMASAVNVAGTLVSSEPSFVTWYGKEGHNDHGLEGYYGCKKHHYDGNGSNERKYREGEHNEDYRGHRERDQYDGKGSYKR